MFYFLGSFFFVFHLFFCFLLLFMDRIFCLLVDLFLFDFYGMSFRLVFVIDWVSFRFVSFISLISRAIFFYRKYYIGETSLDNRFLLLILAFVLSMFLLVFGGNIILVMIGWDGLGLISFLLVVFYQSYYSLDSGKVTIYINRVGDIFFLFCFGYFFLSREFRFERIGFVRNLICIMFLVGAVIKRAQIPFSAWLPAAIAAPTPVSSLVHSSTLVTAGVYVLVRFNYIFFSLNWVNTISCLTMVVSGFAAVVEKDLKKVIAMSTLSQLSVIFFSLSMGLWKLAFLHVLLHALYKSILFLGCGRIMLRLQGRQDSRGFGFYFGGFGKLCFFSSTVSLVGLPFAVGFFSKDLIILLISFNNINFFNMLMFFIGCLLTVLYRIRLIYYGFFLEPIFIPLVENWERLYLTVSVFFLWGWATFSGFLFRWFCIREYYFIVRGLDVFSGVELLVLGISSFTFFIISAFVFFSMFYLRMLRRFLFSVNFFSYVSLKKGDFTWLEKIGPRGFYETFFSKRNFLMKTTNVFILRSLVLISSFMIIL